MASLGTLTEMDTARAGGSQERAGSEKVAWAQGHTGRGRWECAGQLAFRSVPIFNALNMTLHLHLGGLEDTPVTPHATF